MAAHTEASTLENYVREQLKKGHEVHLAPPGRETPDDHTDMSEDEWRDRPIDARLLVKLITEPNISIHRRGLWLRGADVFEPLDLSWSHVEVPLHFTVCRFKEGVNFFSARVRSLEFHSCVIGSVEASELNSDHSVRFSRSCLDRVTMRNASIRGSIDLNNAMLTGEECGDLPFTFFGDGLASGTINFKRTEVTGELRLTGANITGELDLEGAKLFQLHDQEHYAFFGDRLSTKGNANFSDTVVEGELRLAGAQIDGDLNLTKANLFPRGSASGPQGARSGDSGPSGPRTAAARAGDAESTKEGKSHAFVGYGLTTTGDVLFTRATVRGVLGLQRACVRQLDLNGATLGNDSDREASKGTRRGPLAFDAKGLKAATLRLNRCQAIDGEVDLTDASVGDLIDSPSSWLSGPKEKWLFLDGFSYGLTGAKCFSLEDRLQWINLNKDFSPGVYDHLADAYCRAGRAGDAREVGIARESHRRSQLRKWWLPWLWNWFSYLTVRHGYKPYRAAVILIGVVILGAAPFYWPGMKEQAREAMAPSKLDVAAATSSVGGDEGGAGVDPAVSARGCEPEYECFEPAIYVLDVVLPVVDLHQESDWRPNPDGGLGYVLRVAMWILIVFGWLLTTALLAGMGALWRR